MRVDAAGCQQLERALEWEWLEVDGLGGYADGTVAGANTRRYHALLLAACPPPVGRVVLVNQLEEWLETPAGALPLSTLLSREGVHPDGYRHCAGFTTEPWPTWRYAHEGLEVVREFFCVRGRQLVVVRWHLASATSPPLTLRVRPLLSGRDYHALTRPDAPPPAEMLREQGRVRWQSAPHLPPVLALHSGSYQPGPRRHPGVDYPVERQRGLEDHEDLWSPGELLLPLAPGRPATLVLTTEALEEASPEALAESERRRRAAWAARCPDSTDSLLSTLWRATDAYLMEHGDEVRMLAGFPWFTAWGRDTFTALPGLCLVTGRHAQAWRLIESFLPYLSEGMVPNVLPRGDERPRYNTLDASLWFIHAVRHYLAYTGDVARVRQQAWPGVKAVLDGYRRGTRYGIRVDEDGLVRGGAEGVQLTWMDAKTPRGQLVTPRWGKPVEVQALWVRALAIGQELAEAFGEPEYARRCAEDRRRALASFQRRFWYAPGGYLLDVVDGPEGDDASLRPNQLFALTLDEALVDTERARQVLAVVRERLLIPGGLRTLAPGHADYHPRYEGDQHARDCAYHQGTAWPFLLCPYAAAHLRLWGYTPEARREVRALLKPLEMLLREDCLGHLPEILDAEPPHLPRGCFAQAWSVGEILHTLCESVLGLEPPHARLVGV